MNNQFFSISLLLLSLTQSVTCQKVITSPTSCIRKSDCPSSKYCDMQSGSCKNVKSLNQKCLPTECAQTLYCSREGKCLQQSKANEECVKVRSYYAGNSILIDEPCISGHACVYVSYEKAKCLKGRGIEGSFCRDEVDCNARKGYTCTNAKCSKRAIEGSYCDHIQETTFCVGFCSLYGTDNSGYEGTCSKSPKLGEKCKLDNECYGADPDNVSLVCNVVKNRIGTCENEDKFIRKLGGKCNQKRDMCDHRRGLSCRWYKPLKKSVCMQRANDNDTPVYYKRDTRYCDPNNKEFSKCLPSYGVPMECRRSHGNINFLRGFYHCARKVETVYLGKSCSEDYTKCNTNLKCQVINGVKRTRPSNLYKSCVNVKMQAGDSCMDKFRTVCGNGLTCAKNGKCIVGTETNTDKSVTHLGVGWGCGESANDDDVGLKCVSGSTCTSSDGSSRCELPLKTVGKGKHCYDTGLSRRVS